MPTFPLLTHSGSDDIVAWRGGMPVTVQAFLDEVHRVAALLPDATHLLNACSDRYRFTVGLAAAMLRGKVTLLPSTHTTDTIRRLLTFAPDAFCLTDRGDCSIAMPKLLYPLGTDGNAAAMTTAPHPVPQLDGDQLVAYVFTSGSTGNPVPHAKTWGALVRNVRGEAASCGIDDDRSHAIVGTVPPQHMYGFESTVLVALQSGNAIVAGQSFYPADICGALQSVPQPRLLVSTPIHLKTLLDAGIDLPPAELVMSATAPLSVALAHAVEARFAAPLIEIYGSTETGQIAVRHPTRTAFWQLFPDVRLTQRDDAVWASGGHVEQPVPMNDVLELGDNHRFLLHGRTADLVNIAGKRSSIGYLNHQLTSIAGVADGAFFMPDAADADALVRPVAFVVAHGLTPASVMTALRERIEPVFLPRPLVFVDALPRNATGKLPREALAALVAEKCIPATRLSLKENA